MIDRRRDVAEGQDPCDAEDHRRERRCRERTGCDQHERTPPTGGLGPLDLSALRVVTVPRNGPIKVHPAMLDALLISGDARYLEEAYERRDCGVSWWH